MIKSLNGIITDIENNEIVVEVNGIGYGVICPKNTIEEWHIGDKILTYIYMAISENNINLYGFISKITKDVFELLLTVNGVGPKAALSLVGTLTNDEIIYAICKNDWKLLTKATGIGTKAAQKITIELKVKVEKNIEKYTNKDTSEILNDIKNEQEKNSILKDVKEGLKNLGFQVVQIEPILNKIDTTNKTADKVIAEALKLIGQSK